MVFLKILAAACFASSCAQQVSNDDGNIMINVAEGKKVGFQHGTETPTYFADVQTMEESSKQASFLHLGYSQGYETKGKEIDALIKVEQTKLDTAETAHGVASDTLKAKSAAYKAAFGDKIDALRAKLAKVQGGSGTEIKNEVTSVGSLCQSAGALKPCSSSGGEHIMVGVVGEVYSNAPGVFKCHFTWNSKKVTTNGMGKIASATGRLSAVSCDTPTFSQDYLGAVGKTPGKNTWKAALTVKQGADDVPYSGSDKEGNLVEFSTSAPELVSAGPMAEKVGVDASNIKGGKKQLTSVFTIKDIDTAAKSMTFSFAGVDTNYVKLAVQLVEDKGDGVYDFQLVITGAGRKGKKDMKVRMTAADANGGSVVQDFLVSYTDIPNCMIKLATTRGGKVRSWHDTSFWEAKSGEVNGGAANSYQSYANDIKTAGYYEPIGARMDIEFYQGSAKKGVASYDIAKDFQGVSLRNLVSDAKYNAKIIGKKAKSRSNGKFYGSIINTNDGNCGPRKGDGFIDQDYDLRVRMRNEFNSQDSWDRVGFNYNNGCKGGHMFGGIGGTHKHGSWTIAYEAMPIVGYCGTYNGYGAENHGYNNPRSGNSPYRNCGGSKSRYAIDVAITRGR